MSSFDKFFSDDMSLGNFSIRLPNKTRSCRCGNDESRGSRGLMSSISWNSRFRSDRFGDFECRDLRSSIYEIKGKWRLQVGFELRLRMNVRDQDEE